MKILAYDASPGARPHARAYLARMALGAFDVVIGVHDWEELLDLCCKYAPVDELHVWSDGDPGEPFIDLSAPLAADPRWHNVDLVWFRAPNVLRWSKGMFFAERLAATGMTVVGHTMHLGPLSHSGLYALQAHQKSYWDPRPAQGYSAPWRARTVAAWATEVPLWAFK